MAFDPVLTDGRHAFIGDNLESGAREKGAVGGERDYGVSQNKLSAAREGEQVLLRLGQGVSPPEHGMKRILEQIQTSVW